MEYLNPVLAKARQVNLVQRIEDIIFTRKEEIIEKVREQWKQGIRPDGTIIGTYQSFSYQRQKLAQNPAAGGNVDLILTGALNENLTLNKVFRATFTIFSTDPKATIIAQKYGLDVYGLNNEEKEDFLNMVSAEAFLIAINNIYT